MSIYDRLHTKLNDLNPSYLEVLNESSEHSGPANESHFKITIVTDNFNNISLLNRTKKIHNICSEEIALIHAFTVFCYTELEWQNKTGSPISPKCGGA